MPEGCSFSLDGESSTVNLMVDEMVQWMALALPFVYLVMVAQFQSLLSPFIVLFTVPLAFTGGLLGMLLTGQQLTMISLMGFIVLMGTVVNNGIVFVDYANQLRLGGLERRAALVATGKTRMRPILMTTLTTVLAMLQMVFSNDMASQLMSGMAIVIICGLSYATLMTLYIVPILYDILFKKPPLVVDVGDDGMDDIPDDAAEYIAQSNAAQAQPEAEFYTKFWKINLKAFSHKSGKLCYNHNYGRGRGCAALTENNEEGGEPYGTVPLQALWCDQKRR